MSVDKRTSEFSEPAEELLELPPPQVAAVDVPAGTFSNRKGFVILAKKCDKMGYDTRLTYARGWVNSNGTPHLRHSLMLRIRNDAGPVAHATWEAPAADGDEPYEIDYKTKGAIIYTMLGRFGNKELEAWLLDPNTDPRIPPTGGTP